MFIFYFANNFENENLLVYLLSDSRTKNKCINIAYYAIES